MAQIPHLLEMSFTLKFTETNLFVNKNGLFVLMITMQIGFINLCLACASILCKFGEHCKKEKNANANFICPFGV